jgi:lipoic acid synthetase
VQTGQPNAVDEDEPRRVAESLSGLGLNYVVITSVDRDDLVDGGAGLWAEPIRRTRDACPDKCIEYGDMLVKSGMMLGLGESNDEVLETMEDLVDVGVDILNLGQYLRPSKRHLPVKRWVHPDEFDELAEKGDEMGFRHVEAGPLVRSSYRADQQVQKLTD